MQRMQVLRKEMLDEIFPSHIWTKLRSCHHRTKRKHLRVFLGLWPSTKIFQSCLPSKSVHLTFWPLVLRWEESAENTEMNCCSPGSDCLIWPPLVHGGVGLMINKGNTALLPSILAIPPLAPPPSFRSACSGFFPMIQTPLSSLFHT